MRALTLIQPMGWAIVTPHPQAKRIENRPRDLPRAMKDVETVVAVHAGKKWSDDYATMIAEILGITEIPYYSEPGIIGLMRLSGRVYTSDTLPCIIHADGAPRIDPWWIGPFGYEVKDAILFPRAEGAAPPIPCRGKLGFWPLSPELEAAVQSQPGALQFQGSSLAAAGLPGA